MKDEFFYKTIFALISLKYFCEKAKENHKKKIDVDFVLAVINEVLDE